MFFEENASYHIFNRSNETLFYTRENYLYFLKKVKRLIFPYCNILAWCLMPNHFHLLVQATRESTINADENHRPSLQRLSKNIGTLLSSYTLAINKQQNRKGRLFAHQTKAKLLNDNSPISGADIFKQINFDYATACFLYIHQNPLVAGLVEKQEDWEFSSFRDYSGLREGTLINKNIAFELVNLNEKEFHNQSKFIIDDGLFG